MLYGYRTGKIYDVMPGCWYQRIQIENKGLRFYNFSLDRWFKKENALRKKDIFLKQALLNYS